MYRVHLPPRYNSAYMRFYMRMYRKNLQERGVPEDVRKALQNTAAFFSRHHLTRRELFTGTAAIALTMLLEQSPNTNAACLDLWHQEASRLKKLLAARQDPATLQEVREGALALQGVLTAHNTKGRDAAYVWNACDELLRDVGEPGYSPRVIEYLQAYGWRVVQFWRMDRNYPKLAQALDALANLYRTESANPSDANARQATQLILGAYHVIQGPYHKRVRNQVLLAPHLHQALLWKCRLILDAGEPQHAKEDYQRLQELAQDSGLLTVLLETLLEETAYFRLRGEVVKSEKKLAEAETVLRSLPFSAPALDLRLLRAQINFLEDTNKPREAEKHVTDYAKVWFKFPSAYQFRHIHAWQQRFALKLDPQKVSMSVRTFAMLPFLYYDVLGVPAVMEQ